MQDRLENQTRIIAGLEEKCDSLQSMVDQLNSSLNIANSVEADLRAEVQSLQKSLSDYTFSSQSMNDRIKQVRLQFFIHFRINHRINEIIDAYYKIVAENFK